jgi:N-acetylmuramoyl-L-alanine amidase
MVKIVLDPGHGGTSPPPKVGGSSWNNATGPNGLLEKTATLKVALAAQAALLGKTDVLMTRSTDVNLGIADRARVAKDAAAEVFISIHFNAAAGVEPPPQGTETWIGFSPRQKSRDLAMAVQSNVRAATGHPDRGVKEGEPSDVIKNAHHAEATAHCLVEISFLDRQQGEEARLGSDIYIRKLGKAVADGALAYLRGAGLLPAVEMAGEPEEAGEVEGGSYAAQQGRRRRRATDDATAGSTFAMQEGEPTSRPRFLREIGQRDYAEVLDSPRTLNPVTTGNAFRSFMTATQGGVRTAPAALLETLSMARRSVCRINVPAGIKDHSGRPKGGWMATGFLVAPDILLTNHHVLPTPDAAMVAEVHFGYEYEATDLLIQQLKRPPAPRIFRLRPDKLFVSSPAIDGLDYTFVGIDPQASTEFGYITMKRDSLQFARDEPVYLIHHPLGEPKAVSLDDTQILGVQAAVVHYAAETDDGSSGAPVFDRFGRLCALHHAWTESSAVRSDGRTVEFANEGIKISAITIDIEMRMQQPGSEGRASARILEHIGSSDTMVGFFGTLGRLNRGVNAAEAVVSTYNGTPEDVDIGFWNIRMLTNEYENPTRLKAAAAVIADLGLDLWGLSEISPNAVAALVQELQETFQMPYSFALSEPESSDGKQSTAVIWNSLVLDGGRSEWPAEIERWWRLDSRDDLPTEAVEGRIFDRYPGLFHFKVLGRENIGPFDFHFLPLHLKAKAEGSRRRRLASMLLARAVRRMADLGHDRDWIIGGDMNADLASGDLEPLVKADLTPLSASGEAAGAFTYIGGPRSLIDNIFLSRDLATQHGEDDFFIVARDREMPDFVAKASDHRPIALRMSLANRPVLNLGARDLVALADLITGSTPPTPVARRHRTRISRSKGAEA